mgnify:CR=1 FL=1
MNILSKIRNWFKPQPYQIIVDSPTDVYIKPGYNVMNPKNIPRNSNNTVFSVGNVVQCCITGRKAIIIHIVYLPPDRNYMYRFNGIGFDGHGWWSHDISLLAETLEKYLELENNYEKSSNS